MKKTYIIPTAKNIVFSTEENVLNATSDFELSNEEVDDAKSNRRDASQSIWGED